MELPICQLCTSGDAEEQLHLQSYLTKIIKKTSDNTHIIIGQDSNAQIGFSQPREEGKFRDSNIGKYGLHKVDLQGS